MNRDRTAMPSFTARAPDPVPGRRRASSLAAALATAAACATLVACLALAPPREPAAPRTPSPAAAPPDAAAIAAVLDSVPGVLAADLETRLAAPAGPLLLDVRSAEEYAAGHVPGARNLPHDQLAQRLEELAAARDQEVVVYCRTGRRAASALDTLRRAGFTRLAHLRGDYQGWSGGGHPVALPAAASAPP